MTLTLPDELLRSARLTEAELKAELALALFQQERLTLGQAALLADSVDSFAVDYDDAIFNWLSASSVEESIRPNDGLHPPPPRLSKAHRPAPASAAV